MSSKSPEFLVTGGTGFIGRRVVDRLIAEFGETSLCCLVQPRGQRDEADTVDEWRARGVRIIEADLRDPINHEPPPQFAVVFHLAANIDTDAPVEETRVNDRGTEHLLEWLRPAAQGMRVVFASTAAVHDRDRPPVDPIDERSPLVPRSEYGRSKLRAERIVQERSARDGFAWTILRLPTVYGSGEKPGGLFDRLITGAAAGSWLTRVDWPGKTSILHVDDAAAIMVAFAAKASAAGEAYCVASEWATVGELADRIARWTGHGQKPIAVPGLVLRVVRALVWNAALMSWLPRTARRVGWQLSLIVSDGFWFDTTKFCQAYGRPMRMLEEGIAETIRRVPDVVRGAGLQPCVHDPRQRLR